MSQTVEVHLPARVKTDPDALAADGGALVEEALKSATARAAERSLDAVRDGHGNPDEVVVHAPTVKWTGPGLASLPPSTRATVEARVAAALARTAAGLKAPPPPRSAAKRARKAPAWRVLKTVQFRARAGDLTALMEELGHERGLSALHSERAEEERVATLRVIEALRVVPLDEVVAAVFATLRQAPGEQLLYGYTVYPQDRFRLLLADSSGTLAAELPDLTVNYRRAVEMPSGVVLGPGALIAFVSFSLPTVVAEGRIGAAPESVVTLPLRELAFLIEPESFEAAFGVSWELYAREFGDRPTGLRLQPFFTRAPIPFGTLDQLIRAAVRNERVETESWFFGSLLLLTEDRLSELPDAVRLELDPYAPAATRRLGRERERGTWERDWHGAFVYAALTPERAESERARQHGLARERADELIALLQADRSDLLWPYNLLGFLRRTFRRSDPAGFEHLLRELEEREQGLWFARLFDWIELDENGDLHWTLVDLAWRTSYVRHARVTASADLANRRRREYLPHLYFADRDEIWLDRNPHRRLKQYYRIDSIDTDYRSEKVEKVLRPEAEAKLLEQVQADAPQFIEDLLTGKITEEFADMNALVLAMAQRSASKVLDEDSFYERTTERTLQLIEVERQVDPFERYLVTFDIYERVYTEDDDEDSVPFYLVPDARQTLTDVDFQWLVWGWEYHHEAARMEIFAFATLLVSAAPLIVLGVVVAGPKVVVASIVISELIYVGSTVIFGKKFTVEGFVMAAVDGYIGALGFKAGNIPATLLARKIGAETTRRLVAGWVAEKAVVAMIGGAGSAATMRFTRDLVEISLRRGKLSSPEEYIRTMQWGLLIGFLAEAGAPVAKAVFRSAGGEAVAASALKTTGDVLRAVQGLGIRPAAWARMMRDVLAAIRSKLAAGFNHELADRLEKAIMARLDEVGEGLAQAYREAPGFSVQFNRLVLERVLLVSGAQVTRAATPGLIRFARLTENVLDQEAAMALLRRLRESGRTESFFRALGEVDDETAAALVRGGRLESLATSPPVLDALARHRAFLENVGRAPPKSPGKGAAAAQAGDLVLHPRYRNVLIDPSLGADGFEALLKELRRTPEGEQVAQAIVEGRLHVLVHADEIFAGYSGTQVRDEIFAQWTGSIEDTASTVLHEGSHWLDPHRFVPGVKATGPGSSRLVLEATARANEFQLRRLQGLPPQDAVEAAYRSEYDRVLRETGSEVAANRAADDAIIRGLRADPTHYGVETAAQEQRRLAAALDELDATLESSPTGAKPPPTPSKGLPSRAELLTHLNALEWRHGVEVEASTSAPALYDELDQVRKLVRTGDLAEARLRVAKLTALWRAEAEIARLRIGAASRFAPPGSTEAAATQPVRTGIGGKKSIEGLRQVPELPPDAPALPLDQIKVTHRPFSAADDVARQAEILELHKTDPSKAGLEYERFVIAREGPPGVKLDRPGRRPDIGGTEITLVGMHGGLSAHKRQQLWLDLVDTRRVHLIVPQASDLALFEIAQLGRAAEDLLGVSISIEVVLTK